MSPPRGGPARLSFRLKTFTWEPEYDVRWLKALKHVRRPPDALLLSFGIWDMQYPPADDPEKGLLSFETALVAFLDRLERATRRLGRRTEVFWLSVTAVADARLPEWKRPRMSAALAKRYNEIAAPHLQRHGVRLIDTYTSGLANPELSRDGVHFAAPVARHHSQLFWRSLCAAVEESHRKGQRPFLRGKGKGKGTGEQRELRSLQGDRRRRGRRLADWRVEGAGTAVG